MTRTPTPCESPVWALLIRRSSSTTAVETARSTYTSAKSPPRDMARANTYSNVGGESSGARPAGRINDGFSAASAGREAGLFVRGIGGSLAAEAVPSNGGTLPCVPLERLDSTARPRAPCPSGKPTHQATRGYFQHEGRT